MTTVELEDVVGLYEAAYILQLTETRIRQLVREGKFAQPIKTLHVGSLWLASDLLEWRRTRVKKRAGRPSGKRPAVDETELT